MSYLSQKAKFGTELTIDTSTLSGSYVAFTGVFLDSPVKVIIQNDSNVTVSLSDDGVNAGISFSAGVRLVLDMNSSKTPSEWWSFYKGEQLYASSAAGVGLFKISYLYAI